MDAIARYRDELKFATAQAWKSFVHTVREKIHGLYRHVIKGFAEFDVIYSLSRVAMTEGFVCPDYDGGDVLVIKGARHPMIERRLAKTG